MKKFKNESGRSMVEMLGVLAIIGVLSVGGIAGYRTAMNRHRANEILNTLNTSMMVLDTALKTSNHTEITVNADNKIDIRYYDGTVSFYKKGTTTTFDFPINKEICEILARELDVTKWNYLSHEDFNCSEHPLLMQADGFSSYAGTSSGIWGSLNCETGYPDVPFLDGENVSFSTRMQDCDGLTGDKLTIRVGL